MNNVGFKDSGVQWLGEIPQHWEVVPIRAIFQSRNEDNKALKYTQILSLVKDIGIIPYEDKGAMGNKAKDDLSGYKIARKNDFILNKMNAVIGSLGVSSYDGLVSPIYLILYIANPKSLISFYSYLFQSKTLQKSFKQVSYGIMEIRESIDFLDFKNIKIPLPPLDEQRRIAEFLDSKCAKIAEFINAKQKIISLLKEQKLALINESVCGRIHTHNDSQTRFKFKHSGIEWLGEIPQHWEVVPNKYIFELNNEIVGQQWQNYKLLSLSINGIVERDMDNPKGKFPTEFNTYQKVRKGDFVFCLFDFEETPRCVGLSNLDGMITGAYTILRNKTQNSKYLFYLYLSLDNAKALSFMYRGLRKIIPKDDFFALKIPLPPLDEQRRIAEFLDKKCEKIDKAIALIEQEIQAIKEYKTSLIDKAVRGGINV